jgi:hypothetical protein
LVSSLVLGESLNARAAERAMVYSLPVDGKSLSAPVGGYEISLGQKTERLTVPVLWKDGQVWIEAEPLGGLLAER